MWLNYLAAFLLPGKDPRFPGFEHQPGAFSEGGIQPNDWWMRVM
jgi:hypothetical protein